MREHMHPKSLCPHGSDVFPGNMFPGNMFPGLDIVNKFTVKNSCFLIVACKNHTNIEEVEIYLKTNLISAVSHFKAEGQLYLIIKEPSTSPRLDPPLNTVLTGRELQIAMLVALGLSNKQIANQLHISEWTVSAHLRRIFIKLDVDSRAAMVYRCATLIQQMQQHYEAEQNEAEQTHEEDSTHLIEWLSQDRVWQHISETSTLLGVASP